MSERQPTSMRSDLGGALDRVLGRVERIAGQTGDRFPLFADPETGLWRTSRRGSWTGGFWTGLWWLRAAALGEGDTAAARDWTGRLVPRADDDTATRGMTFWYGAGSGHRLTGDPMAAQVAETGRAALAGAFDAENQLVPFGRAFDPRNQPPRGPRTVIDPLAGIVALLADPATTRPDLRSLARTHAGRHVELCLAPDGAVYPEAALPGHRASRLGWARGQAWGMLGFAVAARDLGAEFSEPARRAALWWLDRVGLGRVPHAALEDPASPPDTSAAVIAAAALLTQDGVDGPGSADHEAAAIGTVSHLVERHLRADGVLGEGCYDHTRGLARAHELVWGTYFLAATLAVLSGRVDKTPW